MPVLLGDPRLGADGLRLAFGDVTVIDHERQLDTVLSQGPGEELIVIGEDVPMDIATEVAERYRVSMPVVGVVLVRRRLEIATMSAAIRAGVREVVGADDTAGLVAACRRSLEVSARMRSTGAPAARGGQLVLVFSAKGGCGKTTISTNLAAAIAASGRTVALADFDLQFGDVAVALQLDPTKGIGDAIGMGAGLDAQGVTSLLVEAAPRLDALLAPTSPAEAEFIDADLAEKVLEELQRTHDFVVVDSPPAFTDVILRVFDRADAYLLLTTPDLPAVKNLKVTMDTLDALGMPRSKWHLVVNRSDARAGLPIADIERAVGMRVSAQVPASNAVPASINRGVTLVGSNPRHAVSRAIAGIASTLGAGSRPRAGFRWPR